jgi:lipoprotein-anchoring transpeptidase ErfK/SrfK
MNENPEFRHAVANAYQSLQRGDRAEARRWAERAAVLEPNAEEGWLLLAAVSNPRAGLGYAQRALKVNPNSETARRALRSVMKELEKTAPAQSPARSEQPSKPASRRGWLIPVAVVGLIVCVILAAALFRAAPAVASILKPSSQPTATQLVQFGVADISKPTYTPSPTITPSPTATLPPTVTPTPGVMEVSIVPNPPEPSRAQEPSNAPTYGGNKYILVDISEQHMYVYEGETLVFSFVASTGLNNATRTGLFHVQSKIPNAYGATWNIWMPNWLGIYYAGGLENGIHALPILPNGATLWAGFLGQPISYGCVVLGTYESKLLYDWAEMGTPVEIRW